MKSAKDLKKKQKTKHEVFCFSIQIFKAHVVNKKLILNKLEFSLVEIHI